MIQGLITGFLLLAFIGGWIWAWSRKREPSFNAAARLPLDDERSAHPIARENTP